MAFDHNWSNPEYPVAILSDPEASQYVAGSAWHCYDGDPDAMGLVYVFVPHLPSTPSHLIPLPPFRHAKFPDKEIYFTECTPVGPNDFEDSFHWVIQNLYLPSLENWAKTVCYTGCLSSSYFLSCVCKANKSMLLHC